MKLHTCMQRTIRGKEHFQKVVLPPVFMKMQRFRNRVFIVSTKMEHFQKVVFLVAQIIFFTIRLKIIILKDTWSTWALNKVIHVQPLLRELKRIIKCLTCAKGLFFHFSGFDLELCNQQFSAPASVFLSAQIASSVIGSQHCSTVQACLPGKAALLYTDLERPAGRLSLSSMCPSRLPRFLLIYFSQPSSRFCARFWFSEFQHLVSCVHHYVTTHGEAHTQNK